MEWLTRYTQPLQCWRREALRVGGSDAENEDEGLALGSRENRQRFHTAKMHAYMRRSIFSADDMAAMTAPGSVLTAGSHSETHCKSRRRARTRAAYHEIGFPKS